MAATSLAPAPAGSATAAGRVRANGPVLHPRLVAVVTAVSCAAHVWLAISGHHGAWLSVLMLALAAVCLPCTVHIWRHARAGALHRVTAAAVVMAGLHAFLLLTAGGGAGHVHGGAPPSSAVAGPGSSAQLLLVIGLELVTALLAATLMARLRRLAAWRSQPAGTPSGRATCSCSCSTSHWMDSKMACSGSYRGA